MKPILISKNYSTEGNSKDQNKADDHHRNNKEKQLSVNWEKHKSLNRSSFHKLELEFSKKDSINQGADSFHYENDKYDELESSIRVKTKQKEN